VPFLVSSRLQIDIDILLGIFKNLSNTFTKKLSLSTTIQLLYSLVLVPTHVQIPFSRPIMRHFSTSIKTCSSVLAVSEKYSI